MLRAGVLLVICSGTRQGTEAVPAVGGVRGSGACPAEDPHPRACHPGCIPGESDGIEQENWDVLTRPGARMTATVAPCHAGCAGKAEPNPNPNKASHRRATGKKQPFLEGIPGLSSARPRRPGAGQGQGQGQGQSTLTSALCPLQDSERNRQLSGHRAPDNGGVKVHPSGDWLPACPSHLHVKVSSAAPNPPRSHGRFGRRTGSTWVAGWPDRGTI